MKNLEIIKKSMFIFTILFLLSISTLLSVNGKFEYEKGQGIKSVEDVYSKNLDGVVTLNHSVVTSYNSLIMEDSKLSKHNTYWMDINNGAANSDVRVVNFTKGTKTNWQGKKPTELAKIYESEYPEWEVIGGINADFFFIKDNSEVLAACMQEGEFYKPFINYDGGHGVLGFYDDGTAISDNYQVSEKEYVQKLNKETNEYEDVKEIDNVDSLSETGISLLTRFLDNKSPFANVKITKELPYDLTDYTVYSIKYDVQRFDRDTKFVYVKGEVTNIEKSKKTYTIDDKDEISYLVCKDDSLNLKVGDQVRCQKNFLGKWEGVKNTVGFYNIILQDGEIMDCTGIPMVDASYINANKNRTIVGVKPDGSPVFMVIEKGSYGAEYKECALYLKSVGCVDGYLLDGGGSSCMFIKDERGNFKTLNNHEDGHERADGSALFLVKRREGFDFKVKTTRFTATIDLRVIDEDLFKKHSDFTITVNGETKEYKGEPVVFENLRDNARYDIFVNYKTESAVDKTKKVNSCKTSELFTDQFVIPDFPYSISEIGKDYIICKKDTSMEGSSLYQNVTVYVGDNTYQMGENETFKCSDLISETTYDVSFKYEILDPETNKTMYGYGGFTTITTTNYDIPSITTFELISNDSNEVKIKYSYNDPDKVVDKAYISYGDKTFELKYKSGTAKITDFKLENIYNYKFVLTLVYKTDLKVTSEEIKVEAIVDEPIEESQVAKKTGCSKNDVSKLIFALSGLCTIVLIKKRH